MKRVFLQMMQQMFGGLVRTAVPAVFYFVAREGRQGPMMLIPLAFAALELAAVAGAIASPEVRGAALTGALWIGGAALLYFLRFRR